MTGKSRLQQLMETPEENLEVFSDTIEDRFKEDSAALGLESKEVAKPVKRYIKKKKYITVEHQWNGDDFVWHMASHPKKPWKVDGPRLILATAQCMNSSFPKNTKVDIWRPEPNTAPEWSFRAYGVRGSWMFDEGKIYEAVEKLLETLNTLV